MGSKQDLERATKRIAHVKSHLDVGFKISQLIHNIENNVGNPIGCTMLLAGHAEASAIYAWFAHRDLVSMRQWFYVASKLVQRWYQLAEDTWSRGATMFNLLFPLLSNDKVLVEWFAGYDQAYDMERVENHKTADFWAYQAIIALRGEWDRLAERCTRVISDPPGASVRKKYLMDHHFYLALAHRDIKKMTAVLEDMVTAKAMRSRSNDDSGYAADLISTAAVIYAKIAWHHSCEVRVDSPYIPSEWLSTAPLESYHDHYAFLK
jgi:hypothetical protein